MSDLYYLRPSEVAKRLALTPSAVYAMIRRGDIPSIRISERTIRVPAAAFDAYLRARESGARSITVLDHEGRITEAIKCRVEAFEQRAGVKPWEFLKQWNARDIADTPENADLAIEALALREASKASSPELVPA